MPLNNAQQAIAVANLFQQIAQQMYIYIKANIAELAKDQASLNILLDDQARIISYGNTLLSSAEGITFGNDPACFGMVDQATKAINDNINTLKQTDKWIAFAGAVISLGTSIVTGNGSSILTSAETILNTFHVKIPGTGNGTGGQS
jgi:hypothetical protein